MDDVGIDIFLMPKSTLIGPVRGSSMAHSKQALLFISISLANDLSIFLLLSNLFNLSLSHFCVKVALEEIPT